MAEHEGRPEENRGVVSCMRESPRTINEGFVNSNGTRGEDSLTKTRHEGRRPECLVFVDQSSPSVPFLLTNHEFMVRGGSRMSLTAPRFSSCHPECLAKLLRGLPKSRRLLIKIYRSTYLLITPTNEAKLNKTNGSCTIG